MLFVCSICKDAFHHISSCTLGCSILFTKYINVSPTHGIPGTIQSIPYVYCTRVFERVITFTKSHQVSARVYEIYYYPDIFH